jgi:hypothetical protein
MKFESVPLGQAPTQDQWYSLDVFKERVEAVLRERRRLNLHGTLVYNFSQQPDGTYACSGAIPSDDDLRLLYYEFRHLYAQREPGNFFRVLGIVSRCTRDDRVIRCMKHLKMRYRSEIVESGFFRVDGKRLSGKQLIDSWFNGRLAHSDRDRRQELATLNSRLGSQGVRILLFQTIWDAILGAKNLYYLIKDLRPDNLAVLLPGEFSNVNEHRFA